MKWNESLLEELEQKGWLVMDPGLDSQTLQNWRDILLEKRQRGEFRQASIADSQNLEIRSDQICWLEPNQDPDRSILKTLNEWRQFLTQSFMVAAPHIEAHFAIYPKGHFYKRHCDQRENTSARVFTFVVYLHSEWQPGFGGELVITEGDTDRVLHKIEPKSGRVVIFKSDEVWHEVRKSNFERFSLTGWFRANENVF